MPVRAVVVTFNRKHLALECLQAIYAQTVPVDHVYLVDNHSTDGTPELLREAGMLDRDDLTYLRLEHNAGSSGGFARGVEAAREAPSDWLWIMDDDSEPLPDALERMLDAPPASDPGTVSLAPKVVYASTGEIDANQRGEFRRRLRALPESAYRPGNHVELGYMSFVGSLVRTEAARRIGLPKAEFFIWGDDVEYSLRLREHGAIRLVPESVVLHKRAVLGYETARSRRLNRISPVRFNPSRIEGFWQNLCGLRNYIWMKKTYEGQGPLSAAGTTLQFVVKHAVWDDQPLRRIPWILRYARAGRRDDFRNVTPAQWTEMIRRG